MKTTPRKSIDQKDFFRQATLKICGSLDINKALRDAMNYLRNFLPADAIGLVVVHPEQSIVETVAGVMYPQGAVSSMQISVTPAVRKKIEEVYLKPDQAPQLRIVPRMKDDMFSYPVARALNLLDASCLQLRLKLEGVILGLLGVVNTSDTPFTDHHAMLLEMLNEPFAVALSNYLRHREVIEFKDRLVDDNQYFQYELRRAGGGEIVGAEFGLKGVMDVIRQAAPLESPILLLGETGAGKEVIANAIHDLSPRRNGPFIKVNCGAIPPTIMDSELFGHEKGAFTGAISKKRGRFERAHGGTIFLDEIGELPMEAQVRLLRVLQEKEFDRVGGAKPVQVDIRVIAATHRNLEAMLHEGTFRQDLYYRLRVVPLVIPPLRERTMDIPLLVHFFIQKKTREMGLEAIPTVGRGEIDRLMEYSWPGNVRELENAVERALILNRSGTLTFKGLADTFPQSRQLPTNQEPLSLGQALRLDDVIADHIAKVLKITKGTVHGPNGAAQLLDLNPSTLRQKMRRLGIPFGRDVKRSYSAE